MEGTGWALFEGKSWNFPRETEEKHDKTSSTLISPIPFKSLKWQHSQLPTLFTIIILPASSGLWQRAYHKQRSSLPTFMWRDGSATGKECGDVCWREKCQKLKGDVEEVNSWDLILWPQHKIRYKAHTWTFRSLQHRWGNPASWPHFHTEELTCWKDPKFTFTLDLPQG
jgi:hypothetical protein